MLAFGLRYGLRRVVTTLVAVAALGLASPAVQAAVGGGDTTASTPRMDRQSLERDVNRATDHYAAGEFAEAERLFAAVLENPSANDMLRALAAFNRGAALLQLERFEEAVEAFDAAETGNFPYMDQLYFARGIAWERLGRNDLAANEFSSALLANPNDPTIMRKVDSFFFKK